MTSRVRSRSVARHSKGCLSEAVFSFSGSLPEGIADPTQIVGNADALDHPVMQIQPIVEVGRHNITSRNQEHLVRFEAAVIDQQGFVRVQQRRRKLVQGSDISPDL